MGRGSESGEVEPPSELEQQVADALEHIWFALLVGWSGGRHSQSVIVEKMAVSAELVLLGAETRSQRQ